MRDENPYRLPPEIESDLQLVALKRGWSLDGLMASIYETVHLNGLYEDIMAELEMRHLIPKDDVNCTIRQMVTWADKHDEMSLSKEDLILNTINEFKDMLAGKDGAEEDK